MRFRVPRRALLALLAVLALPAALPAGASASVTPRLTLTPNTVSAGATHALGLDLTFSPSSVDYPTSLSLALPAGLFVDANLDGGTCLSSATPMAGCELGSGTAATPLSTPDVSLWLVKGPSTSDVAGAALVFGSSPAAPMATADITLRATPDVGLDVSFANLPAGLNALSSLNLTLSGVRAPTSCPTTPATVGVGATSLQDSTPKTTTAPLTVTGCGSLRYAPTLTATVDRNASGSGATFTATVSGGATEAATNAFEVHVPSSIAPSVSAALRCLLGTPCTIGTASASSRFLPSSALNNGTVQLGGSITAPVLSVIFPAPYRISLTGTVDLGREVLTFNGIPDLPLTSLAFEVGGSATTTLFTTTCAPSSLTVKLTPWDGGAQDTTSAPISFGGSCPPTPATTGPGTPTVTRAALRGLAKRAAKLTFTVNEGKRAKPIKRIALSLPNGLTFSNAHGIVVRDRRGRKVRFTSSVRHGELTITLSSAAAKAEVSLAARAIKVSAGLSKSVKSQLRRRKVAALDVALRLTDSAQKTTKLTLRLRPRS